MDVLFSTNRDIDQDVYRNITTLRVTEDLFDDLTQGESGLSDIAIAAEMRVKSSIPSGSIERGFHYSTAITYPFETEPYLASRYGDGHFGVWYGSMELETSIYETAHHMARAEKSVEGINEIIIRERKVYLVHCHAVMLDLTPHTEYYPQLTAKEYDFTQQLGRRLMQEGHPGLLAPSARRPTGTNVVVFNPHILSQARSHCFLTYLFDPQKSEVRVQRTIGKNWMRINV
jgi:hypothetical protein